MMKKLLLLLTIPALSHAYDFVYYEQKTRELLPILDINEVDVIFICCRKEPSVEQRMKNPNAVFLNIELLNNVPEDVALFECAVQAQLTQLNWGHIASANDTAKADQLYTWASRISLLCTAILPIYMIAYMSIRDQRPIDQYGGPFCGFTSLFAMYYAFIWLLCKPTPLPPHSIDINRFNEERISNIVGCWRRLLAHEKTNALACIGFGYIPVVASGQDLTRDLPYTRDELLIKFKKYTEKNPISWNRIQKNLPEETRHFFSNFIALIREKQLVEDYPALIKDADSAANNKSK